MERTQVLQAVNSLRHHHSCSQLPRQALQLLASSNTMEQQQSQGPWECWCGRLNKTKAIHCGTCGAGWWQSYSDSTSSDTWTAGAQTVPPCQPSNGRCNLSQLHTGEEALRGFASTPQGHRLAALQLARPDPGVVNAKHAIGGQEPPTCARRQNRR